MAKHINITDDIKHKIIDFTRGDDKYWKNKFKDVIWEFEHGFKGEPCWSCHKRPGYPLCWKCYDDGIDHHMIDWHRKCIMKCKNCTSCERVFYSNCEWLCEECEIDEINYFSSLSLHYQMNGNDDNSN